MLIALWSAGGPESLLCRQPGAILGKWTCSHCKTGFAESTTQVLRTNWWLASIKEPTISKSGLKS